MAYCISLYSTWRKRKAKENDGVFRFLFVLKRRHTFHILYIFILNSLKEGQPSAEAGLQGRGPSDKKY